MFVPRISSTRQKYIVCAARAAGVKLVVAEVPLVFRRSKGGLRHGVGTGSDINRVRHGIAAGRPPQGRDSTAHWSRQRQATNCVAKPAARLSFRRRDADSGRGLDDRLNGSVRIVIEIIQADAPVETAAPRKGAVVVNEVGLAVEVKDPVLDGVAVGRIPGDEAARRPRPGDGRRGGVTNLLPPGVNGRVGKIIEIAAPMEERPFRVIGQMVKLRLLNGTGGVGHARSRAGRDKMCRAPSRASLPRSYP